MPCGAEGAGGKVAMAEHFDRDQLNKDVRDIQPLTMTEKSRAAIDANTPRRPV